MAHVAPWKKEFVENLQKEIKDKQSIGIVKINGIPATQLNQMREMMREKNIFFKVGKKTLIGLALERISSEKSGVEKLKEHMDGQIAIVAADMNPFKLYRELKATLQPMAARGGEIAPDDIVVKKGDTPFKPGPIISEFQRAGIPAAIDKGKIVIKSDKVVVKKGEVISREVALALAKLEIYPLEVGLIPQAIYEDNMVFLPEHLDVNIDDLRNQFTSAARNALNLAVNIAYVTPMTIEPLVMKAATEAMNLAINAGIVTPETADRILSKAYMEMLALARLLPPEALDDELRQKIEGMATVTAAAPATEEKKDDEKKEEPEEEEEEVSEEEAAAGLGALFG